MPLILVEFLTVQPLAMVNARTVNGAVQRIPYSSEGIMCHINNILY